MKFDSEQRVKNGEAHHIQTVKLLKTTQGKLFFTGISQAILYSSLTRGYCCSILTALGTNSHFYPRPTPK